MNTIKSNMDIIKNRIENSCEIANRKKEDVKLIAVTKTVDVDVVKEAINCGATDVGENKPQELARKFDEIGDKVRWHLIGSLQTNKVKYIIDKVYMIHSIDRLSLCEEIQKRAEKIDKQVNCLIQVNISKEESKHGILEEDAIDFIKAIAKNYPNIRVKGLMTMAPNTEDKELVRSVFKSLKDLSIKIDNENIKNVSMNELSMGMSND
ncbi:MAG: YggS family pyridoxal phosphate-dependent enzyme, partial [Paraclostridium sp.]